MQSATAFVVLLSASLSFAGCQSGAEDSEDAVEREAAVQVLAIVPADGSPVIVLDGSEELVRGEIGDERLEGALRLSGAALSERFEQRAWQLEDAVAFGSATCSKQLATCAKACEKVGKEYRTRRQEKWLTCEESDDPNDVCWTHYGVQCRESWFVDADCETGSDQPPQHVWNHVCD